tara:strand:- start:46432 stop:46554 length:123 start_codon:yes stop_codon:yes gene_type:complete
MIHQADRAAAGQNTTQLNSIVGIGFQCRTRLQGDGALIIR